MVSTSATPACPRCGTPMPSAFVGRVCARCLLTSVLPHDSGGSSSPGPDQPLLELKIGERFGDYDLVDILGRGGMAVVFLARQISLDRLVALKTVAALIKNDAQSQERFRREARAVSRLDHPNIVSVHDVGTLPEALYYTMEYIEGEDLGSALHERWFTARESASLMLKVTEAMAYAHSRGVIHRDLKPGNILLDQQGEPHVADFGLAIELGQPGRLTLTGDFLGTPAYTPPERIDGQGRDDPAGDIYALGAILFQTLTGRAPFVGGSSAEILHAVMDGRPPSPRLLNPNVSRDLETICLKCLEREPAKRYPAADALAEDLRRFLDGRPITARPISPGGRFVRWCRRKPAFAAVWFLLVALAVGSTLAAFRIHREEVRAEGAFTQTRAAEEHARDRLRDAKISEARAIRRTLVPGRRQQALAALAEAARIRPGADLRDEALAAMTIFDMRVADRWDLHLENPNSITFDPAGWLATVEARNIAGWTRGPARLFKWGSRQPFATLSVPGGVLAVGPMRFGAGGALLMARYDDAALRLWRVGEDAPFLTVPHRPAPGGELRTEFYNADYDFTPDGASFALGLPGKGLALYRVADGAETARWAEGESFNLILASPDGRFLAAANLIDGKNRVVHVLSVPDLRPVWTFTLPGSPDCAVWSADSRVLAVEQGDGNISGYDVRDGQRHSKAILPVDAKGIRFLGRDRFFAAQNSNNVNVLNIGTGREELEFTGVGPSPITAAPQGDAFFFSSNENVVSRVTVDTPMGLRTLPPPRAFGNEIVGNNFALDFSPDGRRVACSLRRYLTVSDVESGRVLGDLDTGVTDSSDTSSVAFSGDGRALYRCSTTAAFTGYPLITGADGALAFGPAEVLDGEKGFFIADQTADRKKLVLLNFASGAVRVVTVDGGKLQTLARWVTPGIYNASLSPDGSRLLTNCSHQGPDADAQRLRVYRVNDGSVLRELPGRVSCDTAWSADGRTAVTSDGVSETTLWDAADWRARTVLKGELGGDVTTFCVAPDNQYMVVTHDDRIHFVSLHDGALLASFQCPGATGLAASVRFLPDGKRFAILWRDARVDIVDPPVLRRGLAGLGLDW